MQVQPGIQTQKEVWPALSWDSWKESCETVHMWTQIVGKVKLELTPFWNEWWEAAFDVSASGLSTGLIPFNTRVFEINFDFLQHRLVITVSDGRQKTLSLFPRSVADFYSEFFSALRALDIEVAINTHPVETTSDIPFEENSLHSAYDAEYVQRWWKILTHTTRVLQRYRSRFVGKSSPILFYWGSFDLNITRFSGQQARMPAVGPRFYKIGEDQENVSCGFWPGNTNANGLTYGAPAFYSYTYPAPRGFESVPVNPTEAYFDKELAEFILPYEHVRNSTAPEQVLLDFFQSTYEVGANLGHWDRATLEQSLSAIIERTKSNAKTDEVPGRGGSAGSAA
ncbi:MAG: hypothetical protein JWQ35_2729 [Bacteriovoracaceae bacterium]|nr:hypothetical protein [Bacteriovoracaceae bacterium]